MKEWLEKFWWTRGFLAALAVIGLLADFVDLSKYEILLAFNIVALSWNTIAGYVGEAIGEIPFLPTLKPFTVNVIIVFTALFIPALAATRRGVGLRFAQSFWLMGSLYFLILSGVVFIFSDLRMDESLYEKFPLAMPIWTVALCLVLLAQAMTMPAYRRAFIYVVGFIIGLQLVFVLSAPWTADFIRDVPCKLAGGGSPHCQAEAET